MSAIDRTGKISLWLFKTLLSNFLSEIVTSNAECDCLSSLLILVLMYIDPSV